MTGRRGRFSHGIWGSLEQIGGIHLRGFQFITEILMAELETS